MQSPAHLNDGRSLDEALPRDVWVGLGRFAAYQRYRRYTWPWFRQRSWVLWPFAIANGFFFGMWHASSMTTWHDLLPLGSRAIVASILTVSLGPLLALGVRYRRLPYRTEVAMVIVAIIAGMAMSHMLQGWVGDYHEMLMSRHHGKTMANAQAVQNVSQTIGQWMGRLPYWLGLFLVGGGWELRSYFSERRLLAEHVQLRDLDALRREKAATDLRLAVLQAQIEPHFLFNTLASIRSVARSDPERVEATINALSSYLRTTLPKLRQEIGTRRPTRHLRELP